MNQTNMMDLPDEILMMIADQCGSVSKNALRSTNKRFDALVERVDLSAEIMELYDVVNELYLDENDERLIEIFVVGCPRSILGRSRARSLSYVLSFLEQFTLCERALGICEGEHYVRTCCKTCWCFRE
jgi:hypothetical protein